jgi:hypothetical protein
VAAALESAGYRPEDEWSDPAITSPGQVALFGCLTRKGALEV